MGALKEEIESHSEWIVKAFAADKFKLDYTIDSLIEVDRFFIQNMYEGQPKKGGRLAKEGYGTILFAMGSYLGATIIKKVNGAKWEIDETDPQAELNVSVKLPDESRIWPVQKVMKRFQNGSLDAIYPYVHMATREFINQPFNDQFWTLTQADRKPEQTKSWWKFW